MTGGPVPTVPTPAWASPACRGRDRPSSSSSQSVFSSREVSGGGALGGRVSPGKGPAGLTPSPQLECWAYLGNAPASGNCPGLREETGPQVQRKRETGQTGKKALTGKREGRGWVVRGGEPGLQPLSALLAQLSRGRCVGRHVLRGEERTRGTGRYWKPILQDNQGCWAGWDHLAIVRSDHWACTSWPCPKTASGFWPGSSSTLPRSW